MRANNAQGSFGDDRQREHQRQQERLRAMAAASDKVQTVSADLMIENLLKDSFKKLPQMSSPVSQLDQSQSELPLWLQCESAAVPAQYKCLWALVQSTVDLADTQKVSQLLLTSGLHVDLLGFIWNLANKTIPGQLTKQEFYIVLALVGLAQTGYTFNNLSILKLITVPSIPVLQVSLQNYPAPQPYALQNLGSTSTNTLNGFAGSLTLQSKPSDNVSEIEKDKDHLISSAKNELSLSSDFEKSLGGLKENTGPNLMPTFSSSITPEPHLVDQTKGLHKNSNFPYIGSSPTAELEDDFSDFQSVSGEKHEDQKKETSQAVFDSGDDFTEFQSANVEHLDPFETVVISQKREIPKIPLPKSFTGKFTNLKSNILKISPETERKLKVLSPTESLSSLPESKISTNNKVSTSISVLGSNQGIGSRLANHSFSTKVDRPKCHKHHKIKINPISPATSGTEDEVILGVKPRSLENVIPKCRLKNTSTCKTFILKETKIRSNDSGDSSLSEQLGSDSDSPALQPGENTRQIEIPMLGTFNETVLPTQSKAPASNADLITVQEDKYSALREIELELNQEQKSDSKEVNDDFGDFLSADIPPPAPAAASQLLSAPAATPQLLSTPDVASQLLSTPPAIPQLLSTPDAVSQLLSTPAATPQLLSTPDAAFQLLSTPAATTQLLSTPADASQLLSNPAAVSDLSLTAVETVSASPDILSVTNEEKEDWGDWNFSTEANLPSTNISGLDISLGNTVPDIKEAPVSKTENDLFGSFTMLTINEKPSSEPVSLDQHDFFWEPVRGDTDGDTEKMTTNDVNLFGEKNVKSDDVPSELKADQTLNSQSDNEFWEFLSTDMKPVAEDNFHRQGSIPSLDLKISPTEESEQETVWRKCLDSCHGLIQEGYEIFNNITTKSVLDEVFAASKTEDYLNYLNITFQISKRVSKNFNTLPTIQDDIEKFWGRLQDLCFEYNIKLKHDEDNSSEGKVRCSICLSRIGFDLISQGAGSYHPSCANLWINCVEGTLPFSV